MRAVWHREYGDPGVLEVVDVPAPEPGPGEVVVAVQAVAVNRLDILQRQGPALLPGFSLPHIPGMDVAGEVAGLGPGVSGVAVGQRVVVKPGIHCGRCGPCRVGDDRRCAAVRVIGGSCAGGYAERCVVPATHVFPVPDQVGMSEAACVPTAGSTAWRALVGTGEIRLGEIVVINGAGSGVSIIAIQLAKRAGARVIVTSGSDAKLERARDIGADWVVNHQTEDLPAAVRRITSGRGADMVFDHVGAAMFDSSVKCLRARGRLVFCGTTTGAEARINLPYLYHLGIKLLGVDSQSYREFGQMLDHYWQAGLDPVVDCELPLEDAGEAHRRLEKGEFFGKIVLRP